jgi:ABC-type sugar transport system substrate-binding protein
MVRRRVLAVLAVTGLLVGAAACGDDDDDGGGSGATTTAAAATTAAATTTGGASTTAGGSGAGSVDADATAKEVTLTPEQEEQAKAAGEGELVGIVAATMATEYHKSLNESVKATVESYGMTGEIFDSAEDPNKQLEGVEGFISKGAKAIVVTGLGGETLGPLAEEAADKGILVVQVAGRGLGEQGAVTISVEEQDIAEAEGTAAGEYAAANYDGEAIEVAITDYPSIESLVERADIIEESFLAAFPTAKIVGRFQGGTAENGQASMETALQRFPNITGVLGINDAGNLGAYTALEAAGKTADDAFIFGIDCEPQAVELIEEGTMYKGCVDTNPVGTGELAGDAVALWLAGGTVPGVLQVPVSVFTG